MKKEMDDKLMKQTEPDDLGIRTALEGVEPDEAARDRMFQNIMKKAAVSASAESAEEPKAKIVELPKKAKNRWKLYVPMLAAAALILTVGTIFFASYGIQKLSNKEAAAPQEQDDMPVDGISSSKADGYMPSAAEENRSTREANHERPTGVELPSISFSTSSDNRQEDSPQNAVDSPADIATGDANISPGEADEVENWDYSSERAQSRQFSYKEHDYQVILVVNGCMEIPYDPARTIVYTGDNVMLLKSVLSNGTVSWLGEWSPDGTDWYYLMNADGAPEEDVRYLIRELQKNGADPEALQ